MYGLRYSNTFSPVAKMTIVRLFFAMEAIHHYHFINWILKMFFIMEIFKRKSTWSDLLGLLFRGSLVWFVSCTTFFVACAWFAKFSYIGQIIEFVTVILFLENVFT